MTVERRQRFFQASCPRQVSDGERERGCREAGRGRRTAGRRLEHTRPDQTSRRTES